ncbi:hypothetical protein HMPREF0569_0773 [Micrococcus luteus SK58]|nr:hypothetical protein HMPREF0569_0773 [Micrococcus luteus SK58]
MLQRRGRDEAELVDDGPAVGLAGGFRPRVREVLGPLESAEGGR